MVTVKEILQFAIETDMTQLAHRTFWAIQNQKVESTANSDILHVVEYDEEAIAEMIAQNWLSIGEVKLYVAETRNPGVFAFYYGKDLMEVHMLHQDQFRETPKRWVNGNHLMGQIFHFIETGTMDILYFHRTKVVAYPYYIGHAMAGERVFLANSPI